MCMVVVKVSAESAKTTVWSPDGKLVGWKVQLPEPSATTELVVSETVMVTTPLDPVVPPKRGLVPEYHHSVGLPVEVVVEPIVSRVRASAGDAKIMSASKLVAVDRNSFFIMGRIISSVQIVYLFTIDNFLVVCLVGYTTNAKC